MRLIHTFRDEVKTSRTVALICLVTWGAFILMMAVILSPLLVVDWVWGKFRTNKKTFSDGAPVQAVASRLQPEGGELMQPEAARGLSDSSKGVMPGSMMRKRAFGDGRTVHHPIARRLKLKQERGRPAASQLQKGKTQ